MTLDYFLAALLPQDGVFALFSTNSLQQIFCDSQEELVAALEVRKDQPNWFFCTASLTAEKRVQANVQGKRTLYIDIDCGPEKFERDPANTYATKREGMAALHEFITATALKPTFIVDSGAGLHVYWAFDTDLDEAAWGVLAKMLKATCAAHGLRIDNACTTDSVRVLRPLGGLHYSGKRVSALYSDGPIWNPDTLLTELAKHAPVPAPKRNQRVSVNNDLFAVGPAPKFIRIIDACPAAAFALDNQDQVAEPLWRMMLGLAKHTEEAVSAAMAISRKHSEFSEEFMLEKYEAWKVGPPTCEKISDHTNACKTCPHWGKITSPISLGRPNREEVEQAAQAELELISQPATSALPALTVSAVPTELAELIPAYACSQKFPLLRKNNGAFAMYALVNEDPKDKKSPMVPRMFCRSIFWLEATADAGKTDTEPALAVLSILIRGIKSTYLIEQSTIVDTARLKAYFASKGVLMSDSSPTTFQLATDYMFDQYTRASAIAGRPVLRSNFGFIKDKEGNLSYALGNQVIQPDGKIVEVLVAKSLSNTDLGLACLPQASLGEWGPEVWQETVLPGARQQAQYFKEAYPVQPQLQLAVLLGLASPYMMFVAETEWSKDGSMPRFGCVATLYSRASGFGKSTAMTDVARCFGTASYMVRGGKNDNTANALVQMAAVRSSLPYLVDEVTDHDAETLANLVSTLSGGYEKGRLKQDASMKDLRTWCNVTIMSTNKSQRELFSTVKEATDAKQLRFLEIACDSIPRLSGEVLAGLDRKRRTMLNPHQGCLGAALAHFAVTRGYETMRATGQEIIEGLMRTFPEAQQGRFFVRVWAGVMMTMAALKEMGLMPYHENDIESEYLRAVQAAISYVSNESTSAPQRALRELLNHLAPMMLLTTSDNINGHKDLVVNQASVRLPIRARYVDSGRLTYVSTKAARDWCADNGLNLAQYLIEWDAMGLLIRNDSRVRTTINLARGTVGFAPHTDEVFTVSHSALDAVLGVPHIPARHSADVVSINRAQSWS